MARALIAMVQAQHEAEAQGAATPPDNKTVASTDNISPEATEGGPATAGDGDAL
jgi:hypothetical protein